jgi:hypothetical protein
MSLVTLFTKTAPTFAGIQFDAVLEDTLESSVEITGYTIESGARAADHRVILPIRWSLIVAVSNNPIRPLATDFIGGALSNLTNNAVLSTIAGLTAGFLAGSDETRASSVLTSLLSIQVSGEPFDIDAGDIQLSNMVINNVRRTKTPENENGLFAEVQLQELPTLDTIVSRSTAPSQNQLRDDDPSKSQAASLIDKGEQLAKDVGASINDSVDSIIESIGL